MKIRRTKILALVTAVILLAGVFSPAAAAVDAGSRQYCPSIVIPGVFQSDVRLYNEDGTEKINADGEPYSSPFFLDTTNEIVKLALKEALMPLAGMLLTQNDFNDRCATAVADVLGSTLMKYVASDSSGNVISNVRAVKYNTSLANLGEFDRQYALNAIPLNDYARIAGADHLYFFSYFSFGNIAQLAGELYELIQTAKRETGSAKVNLVPVSQGGSIYNALQQYYIDNGLDLADDVNRVVFIVPAADGAAVLGDIYEYGLLDEDDALYGYMFPSLLDEDQEWLSYLINIILRIMPNAELNKILDMAVDKLIEDHNLEYSTCMWALVPSKNYPAAAEKYLSDPEDAEIKKQTDWYYNAQVNSRKYILDAKEKGVEFFDVVDYNYALYAICDSWDEVNADGIIHTDSESFGATAAKIGSTLPSDYVQADTYCTDPGHHNHIDGVALGEENILDASTSILCETSFYFKGQDHEQTARNDVIIRLATRILTDPDFKDVYSDPEFPQFNYARDSRKLRNAYNSAKNTDVSGASPEDLAAFGELLAKAETAVGSTFMKTADYNELTAQLEALTYKIRTGSEQESEEPSGLVKMFTKIFKWMSDTLYKFFGGKGFSDILFPKFSCGG